MDKKNININKLEKFLENAKGKINEGIEDIGDNNMNKLEGFLFDVKKEKENLENMKKDGKDNTTKNDLKNLGKVISDNVEEIKKQFDFENCEFEVFYKKDLLKEMEDISNENPPFDINFGKSDSDK